MRWAPVEMHGVPRRAAIDHPHPYPLAGPDLERIRLLVLSSLGEPSGARPRRPKKGIQPARPNRPQDELALSTANT